MKQVYSVEFGKMAVALTSLTKMMEVRPEMLEEKTDKIVHHITQTLMLTNLHCVSSLLILLMTKN